MALCLDACAIFLLTCACEQVNIYDNEHGGDHLDLVSHYVHESDGATELLCCCWIKAVEDAWLAVGAADGSVLLMSVARSTVLKKFLGHTGTTSIMFLTVHLFG